MLNIAVLSSIKKGNSYSFLKNSMSRNRYMLHCRLCHRQQSNPVITCIINNSNRGVWELADIPIGQECFMHIGTTNTLFLGIYFIREKTVSHLLCSGHTKESAGIVRHSVIVNDGRLNK